MLFCQAARYLLTLPLLFQSVVAIPVTLQKRDADFWSVRTRLSKDYSGRGGDPDSKYFHESVFDPHYDGRFGERRLSYDDRGRHLKALIQTYLATMNDIGADTWIMHGTLLGWWWNHDILPWDSDLDVQVSNQTMYFLADYYNMTVHHFKLPHVPEGRDYMLEINPYMKNPSTEDRNNKIDARWIDTETGQFIDITSLRPNHTAREEGVEGALMCKDNHHYLETDIFPLRDTIFADTPCKVPYEYAAVLEEEYGKESLTKDVYENHYFNQTSNKWEPLKDQKGQRGVTIPKEPKPAWSPHEQRPF